MTTAVRVEGVSKVYQLGLRARTFVDQARAMLTPSPVEERQVVWALKDVSFEVERGEIFGIIGRNGAGKTTLLKMLSRIIEPTTGRFETRGRLSSLLAIGVGAHPNLTGRENVFLCGVVAGLKYQQVQERFDEIVSFSGVEKFIDTPIRYYSTGMAMRLGFAVAVHTDQQIIIVDEALSVGDAAFQRQCWQKIHGMAANGTTIIFVSHDVSLMTNCTRTMYLENGSIKAIGESSDVVAQYVNDILGQESLKFENARVLSQLSGEYGQKVAFKSIGPTAPNAAIVSVDKQINFLLELSAHEDLSDLRIFAQIFNEQGFCLGTAFTGEPFDAQRDRGTKAEFSIDGSGLVPGRYSVRFTIARVNPHEVLDKIVMSSAFVIESPPLLLTGTPDWKQELGSGNVTFPATLKILNLVDY